SNRINLTTTQYGFVRADTNVYQNVKVPLSAFTWSGNNYTTLVFSISGSDTSSFYLDYITLQSNIGNIPPPTDFSNKQDSNTARNDSLFYVIKGIEYYVGKMGGEPYEIPVAQPLRF